MHRIAIFRKKYGPILNVTRAFIDKQLYITAPLFLGTFFISNDKKRKQ